MKPTLPRALFGALLALSLAGTALAAGKPATGRTAQIKAQIADTLNKRAVFPPLVNARFMAHKASEIRIRTRDVTDPRMLGMSFRAVQFSVPSRGNIRGDARASATTSALNPTWTISRLRVTYVPWKRSPRP